MIDNTLASMADDLRDYMLERSDNGLSEKNWRVAGYRFAKSLSQGRRMGYQLSREFAEGMRIFCEENIPLGAPVLYDVKRADSLEEKAEKLLALATHKNTGTHERSNAEGSFVKLYGARDLAIIASDRFNALGQTLMHMRDSINFIKRAHPTLFVWKHDAPSSSDE